jgi:hypothetical protein
VRDFVTISSFWISGSGSDFSEFELERLDLDPWMLNDDGFEFVFDD